MLTPSETKQVAGGINPQPLPPGEDRLSAKRHDLVFRDKLPLPPEQQSEQVERAAADRDRRCNSGLIQPERPASPPIKLEALEQVNVTRTEPVHTLVLSHQYAAARKVSRSALDVSDFTPQKI
jgi:hypothetical protein